MQRVLIIDDEEAVCWALREALVRMGHGVAVAGSAEEGLQKASTFHPDVILLDVRLPGADGLSIMEPLARASKQAPILVMTAFGNLETAVRAVEGGAFEYLIKPFDLDQALDGVQRALSRRGVPSSLPLQTTHGPTEEVVGSSPAMQAVFRRIALVAGGDSPVLLTGESGTGKEWVSRAIHRNSSFREGPFLPVHIGALNPATLESELFGHVKGAFTGASQNRTGLLGLAEGGTLFIDEIADVPLGIQVKILGVLEKNEYYPVGSNQPKPARVRVVVASIKDLEAKAREGTFRADLFYRLNVFGIALPALRDRDRDVIALAEHFLNQLDPRCRNIPKETQAALRAQSWPGNVRELRNAMEHAVILARGGPILPEHLPAPLAQAAGADTFPWVIRSWILSQPMEFLYEKLLAKVEPILLEEVLRMTGGNRLQAAARLGINRATLRRMLERHGLAKGEESTGPIS